MALFWHRFDIIFHVFSVTDFGMILGIVFSSFYRFGFKNGHPSLHLLAHFFNIFSIMLRKGVFEASLARFGTPFGSILLVPGTFVAPFWDRKLVPNELKL